MAIEDSVSLSLCLYRCTSTAEKPRALHDFEAIRKPRTTLLGQYAEDNARIWQLPDGPEQRERDERYKKIPFFSAPDWDRKHVDEVPGIPPDPLFFPYMLAHDVINFVSFKLRVWNWADKTRLRRDLIRCGPKVLFGSFRFWGTAWRQNELIKSRKVNKDCHIFCSILTTV